MILYVVFLIIVSIVGSTPLGIIGGKDANISSYPYIASFQYKGIHLCGAALLSSQWALTAANCIQDINNYDQTIRLGAANYSEGGYSINVSNSLTHPNYNSWSADFDIALLKLEPKVENVTYLKLPEADYIIPEESQVTLLGWGTKGGVDYSNILQEVEVSVFSDEFCNATWYEFYTDNMFCAGGKDDSKGACTGDSGGPVILNDVAVGVISAGPIQPCGDVSRPSTYAKVSRAKEWIDEYIN